MWVARETRETSETLVTPEPTARRAFLDWLVARERQETSMSAKRETTASQESQETWGPRDLLEKWVTPDYPSTFLAT